MRPLTHSQAELASWEAALWRATDVSLRDDPSRWPWTRWTPDPRVAVDRMPAPWRRRRLPPPPAAPSPNGSHPAAEKRGTPLGKPELNGTRRPRPKAPPGLTFNGETRSLREWAARAPVSAQAIQQRLARGWSVRDALTVPAVGRRSTSREAAAGRDAVLLRELVEHGPLSASELRRRGVLNHGGGLQRLRVAELIRLEDHGPTRRYVWVACVAPGR